MGRFRALVVIDDNPLDPLQAAVAKIVKGEPTKPGAHPWQVKLYCIHIVAFLFHIWFHSYLNFLKIRNYNFFFRLE